MAKLFQKSVLRNANPKIIMDGMSVRPSNTNDKLCKNPCQVPGVERMVGSVVKDSPTRARPAREIPRVAIRAVRERGRLRRSPEAKSSISKPLRIKVKVM